MTWYQWVTIVAIAIAVLFCIRIFFRLVKLGKPTDFSEASGSVAQGVKYSFVKAMSPNNKESAYLHLPTYTVGIIYHIGTFVSLFLLVFSFFAIPFPQWVYCGISACLFVSFLCGVGLFIKRIQSDDLKPLSSPDDYISNLLTTLFQLFTALILLTVVPSVAYYLVASLLLIYIPVGKLKHVVFFFSARYHLGFFYGRRNSWSSSTQKED